MKELEKILERKEINAIKDIEEENERCNTACEGCCSDVEDGECNCRDALIIRIIEKMAERMNDDWIPVKERLPGENQEVWITTKYGEVKRAMYTEHLGNNEVKIFLLIGGTENIEEVSAWQPYYVPEPYRSEVIR